MTHYYLDERSTDLDALQKRLEGTDLIPSQRPLLKGIGEKMSAFKSAGIKSLADLRVELKAPASLASLSKRTGVDPEYLQLLRRTINGFFPKHRSLNEMDWLDNDTLVRLNKAGLKNTRQLFEATSDGVVRLAEEIGSDLKSLTELAALSDLCRIQWVSPTFARTLLAAGFTSTAAVADADPEALFYALSKANEGAKFYKGKVGIKDVRRLVSAAAYVPPTPDQS